MEFGTIEKSIDGVKVLIPTMTGKAIWVQEDAPYPRDEYGRNIWPEPVGKKTD